MHLYLYLLYLYRKVWQQEIVTTTTTATTSTTTSTISYYESYNYYTIRSS